jgi:hypothetical protein
MPPTEIRRLLAAIGWSAGQLAEATGRTRDSGYAWLSTAPRAARIPADVAAWLERQAERITDDPPPRRDAA